MDIATFEPAAYSIPELHLLLDTLGQAPAVIFRKPTAPGVVRSRVERLLRTVYELEEIRKADSAFSWSGIEPITESIARFIAWHERSLEIKRRGYKDHSGALVTHPSMYGWDSDGRAFKGAVDADAYDMVRSEIGPDGDRRTFAVNLSQPSGETAPHISEIAPWIKTGPNRETREPDTIKDTSDGNTLNSLTCSICGFKLQYERGNRSKRSMANASMIRHLKNAKVDTNRHRLLLAQKAR